MCEIYTTNGSSQERSLWHLEKILERNGSFTLEFKQKRNATIWIKYGGAFMWIFTDGPLIIDWYYLLLLNCCLKNFVLLFFLDIGQNAPSMSTFSKLVTHVSFWPNWCQLLSQVWRELLTDLHRSYSVFIFQLNLLFFCGYSPVDHRGIMGKTCDNCGFHIVALPKTSSHHR